MTKVMQVIFTDNKTKGTGVYPDPVRGITEILDFDGNLIMEHDPCVQYSAKEMLAFGSWLLKQDDDDLHELFGKWRRANYNTPDIF